jgi:hypothetical protein
MNIIMNIQTQYLAFKDAVLTRRGAPDQYLEDQVAVLTC